MPNRSSLCPTPKKVRYGSKLDAEIRLSLITLQALRHGEREGEYPTRAYRCPCGGWHLTHREIPPVEVSAGG